MKGFLFFLLFPLLVLSQGMEPAVSNLHFDDVPFSYPDDVSVMFGIVNGGYQTIPILGGSDPFTIEIEFSKLRIKNPADPSASITLIDPDLIDWTYEQNEHSNDILRGTILKPISGYTAFLLTIETEVREASDDADVGAEIRLMPHSVAQSNGNVTLNDVTSRYSFANKPIIDTDGDGVLDEYDLDDDNDGILDVDEYCDIITSPSGTCLLSSSILEDMDGDGIPNRLDLDSDNDGLSDIFESGQYLSHLDPEGNGTIDGSAFVDADNDGLADAVEAHFGDNTGTTLINSDSDQIEDIFDLDSDGDGLPDTIEALATTGYVNNDGNISNDDSDSDGIVALFDDNEAIGDFGGSFDVPHDTDSDGIADYLDLDSDNDGLSDNDEGGSMVSGVSYMDPNGNVNNPLNDLPDALLGNQEVAYREFCDLSRVGFPDDVLQCDEYVIPSISNITFYTQSGGAGEVIASGTKIGSGIIYALYQHPDVNSCNGERAIQVKVNGIVPAVLDEGISLCYGSALNSLMILEEGGGIGVISHQWQRSGNGVDFEDIPGATERQYSEVNLTSDTWFRRHDVSVLDGLSCEAFSNHFYAEVFDPISLPDINVEAQCGSTIISFDISSVNGGDGNYPNIQFYEYVGLDSLTSEDELYQSGSSTEYRHPSSEDFGIRIIVYDGNGCAGEKIVQVSNANTLTAQLQIYPDLCSQAISTELEIEVQGGSPPYSTSINDLDDDAFMEGKFEYDGFTGGTTNSVYIKDSTGCVIELEAIIPKDPSFEAAIEVSYPCTSEADSPMSIVSIDTSSSSIIPAMFVVEGPVRQSSLEPEFRNLPPGDYVLEIYWGEEGCYEGGLDFTIAETNESLTLSLSNTKINQISAKASGGDGSYSFSFEEGHVVNDNEFNFPSTGNYTVTVFDGSGCSAQATISVQFISVSTPDFFTPDSDGVNDQWKPNNIENFPQAKTMIFDRYGRNILTLQAEESWDGNYGGTNMPTGDYWYLIELNDARTVSLDPIMGHFSLYR